ncbi:hypothetical protein J4Q44_G00000320, partial [Coregonus suidteri]
MRTIQTIENQIPVLRESVVRTPFTERTGCLFNLNTNSHTPRQTPRHSPCNHHTPRQTPRHSPCNSHTPRQTPRHSPYNHHTPRQTLRHSPCNSHTPRQTLRHSPCNSHTPRQTLLHSPYNHHSPRQTLLHSPYNHHSPCQTLLHSPYNHHTPRQTLLHSPYNHHTPRHSPYNRQTPRHSSRLSLEPHQNPTRQYQQQHPCFSLLLAGEPCRQPAERQPETSTEHVFTELVPVVSEGCFSSSSARLSTLCRAADGEGGREPGESKQVHAYGERKRE